MSHSDCPADYVEIRRAICPAKRAAVEYALQPIGCTMPNLWYFRINRPTRRNYEFSLGKSSLSFDARFPPWLSGRFCLDAERQNCASTMNRKLELSIQFRVYCNSEKLDVNTNITSWIRIILMDAQEFKFFSSETSISIFTLCTSVRIINNMESHPYILLII